MSKVEPQKEPTSKQEQAWAHVSTLSMRCVLPHACAAQGFRYPQAGPASLIKSKKATDFMGAECNKRFPFSLSASFIPISCGGEARSQAEEASQAPGNSRKSLGRFLKCCQGQGWGRGLGRFSVILEVIVRNPLWQVTTDPAPSRHEHMGAPKLPKIFGEVSAVLSEPGLGQGSGKVFGNIGGPVTLKIHCKESIVQVKKDPPPSARYKTSFPPKAGGLDKGNFGAFLAFPQNLYTRRKTLPKSQDQATKAPN